MRWKSNNVLHCLIEPGNTEDKIIFSEILELIICQRVCVCVMKALSIFSQRRVTDECYFFETLESNNYNTYRSRKYPDWYVALKRTGQYKSGSKTGPGQKAVLFLPMSAKCWSWDNGRRSTVHWRTRNRIWMSSLETQQRRLKFTTVSLSKHELKRFTRGLLEISELSSDQPHWYHPTFQNTWFHKLKNTLSCYYCWTQTASHQRKWWKLWLYFLFCGEASRSSEE